MENKRFFHTESIPKIKSGGMLIIDNFQRYLPNKSISPFAISTKEKPLNEVWEKFINFTLVNGKLFNLKWCQ